MKKTIASILLVAVASFSLASIISNNGIKDVKADGEVSQEEIVSSLNELISYHVKDNATYTKETQIYLDEIACQELLINGGFHADVDTLSRTTYYRGGELWMSREDGNYSYYGTAEGNTGVTYASTSTPLVTPESTRVVLSGEGKNSMQEYYVGLEDIVASDAHEWTYENGVYTSTASEVIEWFKAFTAPCYLGFTNTNTENYISLNKVTIEEDKNYNLILKLYATGDNGKLTSENGVFSQAKILFNAPNFANDFQVDNLDAQWKYGAVDINWEKDTFTFTQLTTKTSLNDGFIENGREVKAGWINASGTLGISYTADRDISFNSALNFIGGTESTRLSLRLAIKDQNDRMLTQMEFFGSDSKDLSVNRVISLNQGDTVYFILNNEKWDDATAYPNGELSIVLNPVNYLVASYNNEFSLGEDTANWGYGSIDYIWGTPEDFTFNNNLTVDNDRYLGTNIEIKSDWIYCESMCAITYKANRDMNITTFLSFVGDEDGSRIAIRIGVRNQNGELIVAPAYHSNNSLKNSTLFINNYYSLSEGDTIYFIFGSESGNLAKGKISINLLEI